MKPTKHASTNYRMIHPFLDAVDASPDKHRRFLSGGFMPLSVESLGYTIHGGKVYTLAHYGEQNGDAMRDPEMTISVDREAGTVDPLTFQNDYMGMYQEVYGENDAGHETYRPKLRTDLDAFLWQWLKNLQNQQFSPNVYEPDAPDEAEDDFSDIDPAEVRAALEESERSGSAFVEQVCAEVERIAASETVASETASAPADDWQQYRLFT